VRTPLLEAVDISSGPSLVSASFSSLASLRVEVVLPLMQMRGFILSMSDMTDEVLRGGEATDVMVLREAEG